MENKSFEDPIKLENMKQTKLLTCIRYIIEI